jgi:hypothetical protein
VVAQACISNGRLAPPRLDLAAPASIHGSKWTAVAVVAMCGYAPRARRQHVDGIGYTVATSRNVHIHDEQLSSLKKRHLS